MGAICDLIEGRASWITGGNPQSPQYWVKKLFGATETSTGIEIDEDKALTYSAVWAAINIISGAIGFLPFIVYRRDKKTRERQPEHPIYPLLHDRPNPFMDALVFREVLQGHVLTWGNAYVEIQRNKGSGRPENLWPLLPNKTEPDVFDNGNRLQYKVTDKNGKITNLPFQNVLHIKGLGFEGIKGYSVIRYAAESFAFGLAAEKYGAKFFGNNASPGGVLEHPAELGEKAAKQLKDDWEVMHKGLDNAHRIAILEEGMKWHEIGIPPEDAQYLETRKFNIDDVARWYSIPPHMLAELEHATFSNIEHQGIMFVTYTLAKWLRRWELECNYKLLAKNERGRYFTEFLVDALLRGDTKSRYDAYRTAINAGWMSRNEARERENLNPAEGLDEFLQPLNMVPAGTPYVPKQNLARQYLVEQTWRQILIKETNALRTMLKKPETFFERMNDFYDKHIAHVINIIEPVIRANGNGVDVEQLSYEYIKSHRNLVLAAKELNGELRDNVEILLNDWTSNEPPRLAGLLTKEVSNALSK